MHRSGEFYRPDAAAKKNADGQLYVVAAPIGNLADISPRARQTLSAAGIIAAEDTRVARKLLSAIGIGGKKIVSLRGANEARAAAALIRQIQSGASAAYLSDAGTPAVSDPGARLVKAATAIGIRVVPIPGASALTCALSAAGVCDRMVIFAGFLPRAAAKREDELIRLSAVADAALVLFEAPLRVVKTIADLRRFFGDDAKCVVAREMTKMHEQIRAASLSQIAAELESGGIPARGEFTLIVSREGRDTPPLSASQYPAARVFAVLRRELPPRRAAAAAAALTGENAADMYRRYAVN